MYPLTSVHTLSTGSNVWSDSTFSRHGKIYRLSKYTRKYVHPSSKYSNTACSSPVGILSHRKNQIFKWDSYWLFNGTRIHFLLCNSKVHESPTRYSPTKDNTPRLPTRSAIWVSPLNHTSFIPFDTINVPVGYTQTSFLVKYLYGS